MKKGYKVGVLSVIIEFTRISMLERPELESIVKNVRLIATPLR